MIRVVLAVLGVLLIWLEIKFELEGFISVGVFLLLPAIITIIVKTMKTLAENGEQAARREEEEARQVVLQEEEKERKLRCAERQAELVMQFQRSAVTKELLHYICNGKPNLNYPERITVYNDRIEANTQGKMMVFDFAARRITEFDHVIETVGNKEELQYVIRPQMAMAEAINSLLDEQYIIDDGANWERNYFTDSDGDTHTSILYVSNYVTLILKTTLPTRSF